MMTKVYKWLTVVLGVAAAVVAIFPFYWMLRTSVVPSDQLTTTGLRLFPADIDFSNYLRAWDMAHLGQAVLNGIVVTLGILLLQLLTCIPAAYALAKFRFRGSGLFLGLVIIALLIPTQATMIPTFVGLNLLGLGDTLIGLVLPFTTSAIGIFMLRQQMLSIPDAIMEAARTDGLGPFRTLISVVTPMSMPSVAAFSMLSIFTHWNDYLWPLLMARSPGIMTPPLTLAIFQNADLGFDYQALAAAAAIVTGPVVILFLLAQRHFVRGMAGPEVAG
jgi:multiple sugar transport system permease protein